MNNYFQNTMYGQMARPQIIGSSIKPFSAPRVRDAQSFMHISVQNIAAMDEYKNKSSREIRVEDYGLGNKKYINQMIPHHLTNKPPLSDQRINMQQISPMGLQQPPWNTASAFGSSQQPNTPFGAQSIGNQSTFLAPQQSSNVQNPFSFTQPGQTATPSTSTGMFGQQTTSVASNPFASGATQPQGANNPFASMIGGTQLQNTGSGFLNPNMNIAQPNIIQPSSTQPYNPFNQSGTLSQQNIMGGLNSTETNLGGLFRPQNQQQPALNQQPNQMQINQSFLTQPLSTDRYGNQNLTNAQQIAYQPQLNASNPFQTQIGIQNSQGFPSFMNPLSDHTNLEILAQKTQDDPFLLGDIEFKKFIQPEPPVRKQIPRAHRSLFPEETTTKDDIVLTPRELSDDEVEQFYTGMFPKISYFPGPDVLQESLTIENFKIRIYPNVQITFLEPIKARDILNSDMRNIFVAQGTSVCLLGPGNHVFSKKARIEVSNVFPKNFDNSRLAGSDLALYRFIRLLKAHTQRRFISYTPESGVYVYEVDAIPIHETE